MTGLEKICKIYGSMTAIDNDGKKHVWLWDFANNKARLKSEMTKKEIAASEKARKQKTNNK